ncbi:MAG: hypothetical protein IKF01_00760 [Bacilli bacterium]|nr:hypothetical protein [Bacilli bacterium]
MRYLRSHSYWYKYLNRDPKSFKMFEHEAKSYYKLSPADRIENVFNTFEMMEKILSAFK